MALFALLVTACLLVAVGYVAFAVVRSPMRLAVAPSPSPSTSRAVVGAPSPVASMDTPRQVVFQSVVRDEAYGQVAVVPVDQPEGPRTGTGTTCERVHFAAGKGLCLVPERGLVSTYVALTLNADFQPIHRIPLSGAPTRARVSSDGRYGAATVFVFGHSYADANFSTQTTMIDMSSGTSLGDLEEYATTRDGATWASEDFNFWGVTFAQADSDVFYATLRSAGRTYLVEGDVQARTMRVMGENVECPSLSWHEDRLQEADRGSGRTVAPPCAGPGHHGGDAARRDTQHR